MPVLRIEMIYFRIRMDPVLPLILHTKSMFRKGYKTSNFTCIEYVRFLGISWMLRNFQLKNKLFWIQIQADPDLQHYLISWDFRRKVIPEAVPTGVSYHTVCVPPPLFVSYVG